jgi:eukaryotic-like serine/threonine-protein kinase
MTTTDPGTENLSVESEEIAQQRELLATYRRTLAHLLQQAAQYGGVPFAPPQTANGIVEARAQIQQIKVALRAAGRAVADDPNDDAPPHTEPVISPRATDHQMNVVGGPAIIDNTVQQGNIINGGTLSGPVIGNVSGGTVITTGGGDYAEGDLDKRQAGVFVEDSIVRGDVIGGDQVAGDKVLGDKSEVHHHYYQPTTIPFDRQQQRNRSTMLAKVKSLWITGLLDQSLVGAVHITLTLTAQPDAVAMPLTSLVQELRYTPSTLPAGSTINDVFTHMGGSLLILGAPGAGKTILLLELARDLLTHAERDEHHPIPVIFPLSSWAEHHGPLDRWLVDELHNQYGVPRKIATAWIHDDQVLPLLDGLDEVAQDYRTACVEAINAFRQEHGLVSMVVCSRIADYTALAVRLALQGAVLVQPLSSHQIEEYFDQSGDRLKTLHMSLVADTAWLELAESPLMLHLMTLAYRRMSVSEHMTGSSLEERRRHLLAEYVAQMFQRRSTDQRYTQDQTIQHLVWLAQLMAEHGQSLFLIERMQPHWLPTAAQRRQYALGVGGIIGLLYGGIVALVLGSVIVRGMGLTLGLVVGSADGIISAGAVGILFSLAVSSTAVQARLGQGRWRAIRMALGLGVSIGAIVGLLFGAVAGFVSEPILNQSILPNATGLLKGALGGLYLGVLNGLVAGLTLGVVANPSTITSVETFRWSADRIKGVWFGRLSIGLIAGAIIGLAAGVVIELRVGLGVGLTVALSTVLATILSTGLTASEIETKTTPNQGIRRSAKNAFRIGGIAALICTVGTGLIFSIVQPLSGGEFDIVDPILSGLSFGLPTGFAAGLVYGGLACIQHLVLRLALWQSGRMPWNIVHFLDHCVERILLRKVGGGYIFIHRLLLDYFASLHDRPDKITH